MAGNVWEWTRDCYAAYPRTNALVTDPDVQSASPAGCSYRVVRGGGWGTASEADVRAAARSRYDRSVQFDDLGFRCAMGR
jgi:formylglycine-generating enzyme required for sulfatase activity